MTLDELIRARKEDILKLAERNGARDVRVFGSVARGEAKPGSDVDLLVRFDKGRSLLDHAAFLLDLTDLLGCQVDVVSENGINPRIRERVLKEAVPL